MLDTKNDETLPFLRKNQISLFFSYPFYPNGSFYKKTYNYHGHLSLGIGEEIFQIHDPRKLKANFLVARMPTETWLYEDGEWCGKDASLPTYRHVHLYKTAESKRTFIFYLTLQNVIATKINDGINFFESQNLSYKNGNYNYSHIFNNCTKPIIAVLKANNVFPGLSWDFLPASVFLMSVKFCQRYKKKVIMGYISKSESTNFKTHKFCLGVFNFKPLDYLQELVKQNTCLEQDE